MKVKDLIKELNKQDPEMDLLAFYIQNGMGHVEEVFDICVNGDALQINLESAYNETNE